MTKKTRLNALLMLPPGGIDLVSAALRHVRDATYLGGSPAPHTSLDQAFHLAGFGPECARKATLGRGAFNQTLGHRFDPFGDAVVEFAIDLDPLAHRYGATNWATRWPTLLKWDEQSRYERTGTRTQAEVDALLSDARDAVDSTVVSLWADGRLPEGMALW
jgi:hypothetical protein